MSPSVPWVSDPQSDHDGQPERGISCLLPEERDQNQCREPQDRGAKGMARSILGSIAKERRPRAMSSSPRLTPQTVQLSRQCAVICATTARKGLQSRQRTLQRLPPWSSLRLPRRRGAPIGRCRWRRAPSAAGVRCPHALAGRSVDKDERQRGDKKHDHAGGVESSPARLWTTSAADQPGSVARDTQQTSVTAPGGGGANHARR